MAMSALHGRVTHKVQSHNIIVTLHRVELDGKATRVTRFIWELAAQSHGGEADEDRSFLSHAGEEVGFL